MPAVPDLNPPARLLMGPGPINADPRVLRAMATPLVGQFDPSMTTLMGETMALYREVFRTANRWTFLVDATARGGIEAALVSLIEPGDRVLVPIFGRFGHLLAEIARRCEAQVIEIETEWGKVFDPGQIEEAVKKHRPKVIAICQGDTSTTMCQPLAEIGRICHRHGAMLQVDATASLVGTPLPTLLGGTCVSMNDVLLPLISTTPTQISAQIPETVRPGQNVLQIRSLSSAQQSDPLVVTVQRPAQ